MGKIAVFSFIDYFYNKYIYMRKGEKKMNVERRVRMCLLIERLHEYRELGKKIGIEDVSRLHGERIHKEGGERC